MRSSLQKYCYMERQSREGGTPTVLNPLALTYQFGPVKSTPDGPEAMVPAKSCDVNTGRNQAMSAPTPMDTCPLKKRSIPSPARSRPTVINGRRPPTVFEEKGFKSDGADNNILGGSTAPSFGDRKGGFPRKKIPNLHKVVQALAFFFGRDKRIEISSKSGVSPCDFFSGTAPTLAHPVVLAKGGQSVNSKQLDCPPQAEPTTEESLGLLGL